MTHSKLPWSVEFVEKGCYLRSATGSFVATFLDSRDADLVLSALDEKEKRTVEELKDQIEDLELEIKALKQYLQAAEESA